MYHDDRSIDSDYEQEADAQARLELSWRRNQDHPQMEPQSNESDPMALFSLKEKAYILSMQESGGPLLKREKSYDLAESQRSYNSLDAGLNFDKDKGDSPTQNLPEPERTSVKSAGQPPSHKSQQHYSEGGKSELKPKNTIGSKPGSLANQFFETLKRQNNLR